jgi:glycosyltransferase involved in cell wall biosynthesis
MSEFIRFHGAIARPSLARFYRAAHVLLLPSATEGWPKVLSEAMSFGVVPVASRTSCIPHYLEEFKVGRALPWNDVSAFAHAVEFYLEHPRSWKEESLRGMESANRFTYENYLEAVKELLDCQLAAISRGHAEEKPQFAASGNRDAS